MDSLNPSARCGLSSKWRQIRPIVELRQPGTLRHRGPRPVRRVRRGLLQRRGDHVFDLVEQDRRRPTRARLVDQPVQPRRRRTGAATWPPCARRHPQSVGDLLVRPPRSAQRQHDPRPQRQRLRRLRPPRPPRQLFALVVGEHQLRLRPPRPLAVDQPGHTRGLRTACATSSPSSSSRPARPPPASTPPPARRTPARSSPAPPTAPTRPATSRPVGHARHRSTRIPQYPDIAESIRPVIHTYIVIYGATH